MIGSADGETLAFLASLCKKYGFSNSCKGLHAEKEKIARIKSKIPFGSVTLLTDWHIIC
jgi:hypothetical protein